MDLLGEPDVAKQAASWDRIDALLAKQDAWDVAGAAAAGCATAFVARPGKVLDPLVERPEIVGADLAEVADAILAIDSEGRR
jgi:2-haloacid dehalogenase